MLLEKFHKITLSTLLTLSLALITLSVSSAKSEAKKYSKQQHYKHIRIESRSSPNKYVIVPVRPGRHGDREVRLPNGRWIDCARNCRWTVQKTYLDFWDYQQQPFGPGYIRLRVR